MAIKRILCVCLGNGDRSPIYAGLLAKFLRDTDHQVSVESTGVHDAAKSGAGAPEFAIRAARRLGVSLDQHHRRHINFYSRESLKTFNLVIVMDEKIAETVIDMGVPIEYVYNAMIPNAWPVKSQEQMDDTTIAILGSVYKVLSFYKNEFDKG